MNLRDIIFASVLVASIPAVAQQTATIVIHADKATQIIPKEIYGQFSENLGTCVYGGLWVGDKSDIPNSNGYRTDVFNALKDLKVPVMRWPGGCFADEYHWKDGIGPREKRPRMINTNWGGTVEDNSFGTNEFLNLCEMLGCEPYISGNVGSGTVEELAKWVEYMTSDADSPMANLRRQNGRNKPWKVKFLGVGNESWGCGGNMRPEYYSDMFRRYSTYCRDFSGNKLYRIASGASDYDYNWTDKLMSNVGTKMKGLSLHYYTVLGWDGSKGSATKFDRDDYYWTLGKCLEVENVIQKHCAIMDKYDKEKKVALILDEWGTWWDEEPGTVQGHLFQQNSMRDALVASLSLDIFPKYVDRLKMCNIAQVVNVLQSVILTRGKQMVLTPTYYVFKMYAAHQDATYLPFDLSCDSIKTRDGRMVPVVSSTASKDKNGMVHISLSNANLDNSQTVNINLSGLKVKKVTGEMLTSAKITDYNSFENPNTVRLASFKDAKLNKNLLKVKLPAMSIVTLELQ
jgi:alpha-N-arabinofuranosidase